jgi:hypothetical protein
MIALEAAHCRLGQRAEDTIHVRSYNTNFFLDFLYQKYQITLRATAESRPILRILIRDQGRG